MSIYEYTLKLEPHICCSCGIVFAIPTDFVANRRKDGESFYCPNRHSLAFPKQDNNGETLSERADRLEEENGRLKDQAIKLTSELDQTQALLRETQLQETGQFPLNTDQENDGDSLANTQADNISKERPDE